MWTCAHHYFVFVGATEPEPKNQKDTNDPSGGSRVLVAGIVMLSTVGEAMLREGKASMHVDGIDARVLAISRRWDLATSVCSEYFLSAEIGRYKNYENVTLNLSLRWTLKL